MLNRFARAFATRLLSPIAAVLVRLGISPDAVTLVGTFAVCTAALYFYPRGSLLAGTLVIVAFAFADSLDGIMARMSGRSSTWGAFLDSTLDRLGDAAIFGGLVLFFADHNRTAMNLALLCLVLGSVVSYARARAEGLGMRADVGIAERADRLVTVLIATFFVGLQRSTGFGLPESALTIVLGILALASAITIIQRMLLVRHQALAPADPREE